MKDAFMQRALELAKKRVGFTSPNPAVGAVIVRYGKIIGEGYHKKAGGPHAEVEAIRSVSKKSDLSGAALYVTLEPCCHYGKTPPCTDLIAQYGFKNVIIGMKDCFQKVDGNGIKQLNTHSVQTKIIAEDTPLAREIRVINQPFIKWAQIGLPYVVMKAAVSIDGRIATAAGDSKWITGEIAREDARLERSRHDAVLVGAGTVLADDPELAAHGMYRTKKLLRIVIDPELSLDVRKKVFRDADVFVVTTDRAPQKRKELFEKAGIAFHSFGAKEVSIKRLLRHLGEQRVLSVFVEGGASVHGSFYDEALHDPLILDQALWYIAPKIIGGIHALSAVGGKGVRRVSDAPAFQKQTVEEVGGSLKVRGLFNQY